MTDSPSSDDSGTNAATPQRDAATPPHRRTPGPLAVGATLLREAVLAWVGVLVLLAGLHGWWFVLGEGAPGYLGYTLPNLLGDLAYAFLGVACLFVAVGSAAERLRRRQE